jgi:hypothetical protein
MNADLQREFMRQLLLKAGMPEWQADMVVATPTNFVRDVVRDNQRSPAFEPSSPMAPRKERKPLGQPSQNGWVDAVPLAPPPGVDLVDAQVRAADLREKIERVAKLAAEVKALGSSDGK